MHINCSEFGTVCPTTLFQQHRQDNTILYAGFLLWHSSEPVPVRWDKSAIQATNKHLWVERQTIHVIFSYLSVAGICRYVVFASSTVKCVRGCMCVFRPPTTLSIVHSKNASSMPWESPFYSDRRPLTLCSLYASHCSHVVPYTPSQPPATDIIP